MMKCGIMSPRDKKGRIIKKSEFNRREKVREVIKRINNQNKSESLCDGRRIIDMQLVANRMWCDICDIPLSFRFVTKEVQRGLASVFHVRCFKCLTFKRIQTSSTVDSDKGSVLYAVNCKSASGCIDSGIGHEQLKTYCTAVNLPAPHHGILKRAEAKVGPAYEARANESCVTAIEEEKRLTLIDQRSGANRQCRNENHEEENSSNNNADANNNVQVTHDKNSTGKTVGLICEYDFGWDKRGSGYNYDSRSGRGSAFGHRSKKVLAWEVVTSSCAMCNRGHDPKDHFCRKNHQGSAKSMEPATAVNLLVKNENFKKLNVRTDVLIGDEDAGTVAHVQQAADHTVEKWIDLNHGIKQFSNKLYKLAKTYSFLKSGTIKYLKRCFSYAVAQNKNNVTGLKQAFANIADHTFGQHSNCGDWCKARSNPSYVFKYLPGGKAFSCSNWQRDFRSLLATYGNKAAKIAPGGSSQRNESFNHMAVTRAPKSRYYGSSAALSYRVAAAVLQKNEGASHVLGVNEKAGLSPGRLTKKYREMTENKRQKKALRQKTVQFKKRRLFLKSNNNNNSRLQEKQGGITYMTGMGTTMDTAVNATLTGDSWIPDRVPLHDSCKVVLVDIETTGFGQPDILQIAAWCHDEKFDAYMFPQQEIHPAASDATGLSVFNGRLFLNNKEVPTRPSAQVAQDFVQFLENCGVQILLVGHNIINFDAPIILKWLKQHGLDKKLSLITYGLTDTLPLLRQGKIGKLEKLAKKFLLSVEWMAVIKQVHNAMTDCIILDGLLKHFNMNDAFLKEKALEMREFFENRSLLDKQRANLPAISEMEGVVSKQMLNKMARQGITMEELINAYRDNGRQGIVVCLGVRVNNKPRITINKRIIDSVTNYLRSIVSG